MSFPDNEPLVTAAGVVALVAAVLGLIASFGLQITDTQRNAILEIVAILAPIAVAALARRHVTPQAKIDAVPVAAQALKQVEAGG